MVLPDDSEDLALILDLQNGNDGALNVLMERYREPLFRYIYRFVHNSSDAAEILEESFVKLYFNRDKFSPTNPFRSWLYTIAANLCRDQIRKQKRRSATSVGEFFDSTMVEAQAVLTPSEEASANDDARQLRDAVDRLPEKLKHCVILFHLEEMSHDAIASLLGCTAKAVETRLYQARKRLQKMVSW
ncbi:MAG: RNA polymerase sigma factor [Verrucomicrobiae bacterium]|nr:RNA polymerase sigma factor [Verrucomicrobiae bacterium]